LSCSFLISFDRSRDGLSRILHKGKNDVALYAPRRF
jgi:hypothetical protein